MNDEEWRPIQSCPGYHVSNHGRVSGKRVAILKHYLTGIGVPTVEIKQKNLKVHRLVAEAFIPNPESKPQINHIDGCRTNNHFFNLEWATASENTQHSYDTGLQFPKHGSKNGMAVLSEAQVYQIKSRLAERGSGAAIAREFGVTPTKICQIKKGKAWRHVVWD